MRERVYGNRHKLLFQTSGDQQEYARVALNNPDDPPQQNTIFRELEYDRRIIPVGPNGYLRPNAFSLVTRVIREFVFSFFLQFCGAIAMTDPNNTTTSTMASALALSFTLPQFVVQIASYGTVGNIWFLFMNLALINREVEESELAFCLIAAGACLGGGVLALWSVWGLRGNVNAYVINPTVGLAECFLLDFIFSFLYGYIWLKVVRTSPRNEPPVVDSPYASLTMAAFAYVAIITLEPFTGAGINGVRTLAPCLIAGVWPAGVGYTLLGKFAGYSFATISFIGLYTHPVEVARQQLLDAEKKRQSSAFVNPQIK